MKAGCYKKIVHFNRLWKLILDFRGQLNLIITEYVHTFFWHHMPCLQSFSVIFPSDFWQCWNKCRGKLLPKHLRKILSESLKIYGIRIFARICPLYKLEIHLTLQNVVHNFPGRHPKFDWMDSLVILKLLIELESKTAKKPGFLQDPKSQKEFLFFCLTFI